MLITEVTLALARTFSIIKNCLHQSLSEEGDLQEEGKEGLHGPNTKLTPSSSSQKPALYSPVHLPGFPHENPAALSLL